MQLSPQQWLAVGAAAAFIMWPQIKAAYERAASSPAAGKPKPGGGDRPAIVSDVLDLQDAAKRLGNPKAAELLGQAAVSLIEAKK